MKHIRNTILASAVAAALAVPFAAQAASSSATGAGAISTPVDLNFSVLIPRFIFLRVGNAVPASVNTLSFAPTVDQMANSTAVDATGGDTGPGNSDVTTRRARQCRQPDTCRIESGEPDLGRRNNIPTTTLTASNPIGSVAVPAFGGNVGLTASPAGVVNETGSWRYTWTNPAATVYAAGTYTGTVTYTLSAP